MSTLSDYFRPLVALQTEELRKGKTSIYALLNFETLSGTHFQEHHCYAMRPDYKLPEFELFNKSVELLDAMPDGEYRVYNFIFGFSEQKFRFDFQHLCYFFIKNKNDRAYLLNDVSFICEANFNRLVNQSYNEGTPKILFQKMD